MSNTESFKNNLQKYGLLTTGVLLSTGGMQLKASIVYTDIADVSITAASNGTIGYTENNFSQFFDIDGDGTDEFRNEVYFYQDFYGNKATIGKQFSISSQSESSETTLLLNSMFGPGSAVTENILNRLVLYANFSDSGSSTDFYTGLKFQISGETHYAWIGYNQVTSSDNSSTTLTVKDWAYENVADSAIQVGATSGGALPVELIAFDAEEQDGKVMLDWSTAMELDNRGFNIQRSSDSRDWKNIGFVEGNNTTDSRNDYQFEDENPLAFQSYYRLQQLDTDGVVEYTEIVTVNIKKETAQLSVFPNPVNNDLTLNVELQTAEDIQIILTDINGRQVSVATLSGTKGMNAYKPDVSDLAAGMYMAQIRLSNEVVSKKFIKN